MVVPLVTIVLFSVIISFVFLPVPLVFSLYLSASSFFIRILFYTVKMFSYFDFLSIKTDAGIFFIIAYPVFLFTIIWFFKNYKKISGKKTSQAIP